MLPIIYKQISYNTSNRNSVPIKWICLHYTANYDWGANPEMHYQYFNSGNKNASADFFVDDSSIWCINKDYINKYCWAIGDNTYFSGRQSKCNINTINIEICVNKDSDLIIAQQNAINLTASLMKELLIPLENVVRHKDCSGKDCPLFWVDDWVWKTDFKDKVLKEMIKVYDKNLSSQDIVKRASTSGDQWNKSIDAIVDIAKSTSNLCDLETMTYLRELIKKIYDLDR